MAIRGLLIDPNDIYDNFIDATAFDTNVSKIISDTTANAGVLTVEGSHTEPTVGQIWPRLAQAG